MSLSGQAIVIVGSPRSGTSTVAGALSSLGVFFGRPESLFQPDEFNAGGYFEHKALNHLHRSFQGSLGSEFMDFSPMPAAWRERPMSESFIERELATLNANFSGKKLWGFKDPQCLFQIPFVRGCFSRIPASVHLVHCVRHPLEVMASAEKRHGAREDDTLSSWLFGNLAALLSSQGMSRSVVLFDQLLADPRHSLQPVVRALGLAPSADDWAKVESWVEPSQKHETADLPLGSLPNLVGKVYDLCREAAGESDASDGHRFALRAEALCHEYASLRRLFDRTRLPEGTLVASWDRAGRHEAEEIDYVATGEWQVLRAKTRALPGTRVSLALFLMPAIVWVRRLEWVQGETRVPAKLLPGKHGRLEEQLGIPNVWVFHGYEQVAVEAPIATGAFELELELLVESGSLINALTFKELSERALDPGSPKA